MAINHVTPIIMEINHETPIIMEIKCPLFSIGQSKSKKKELQNQEVNTCNSSHHGASMPLMPINLPNGYQKPIIRRSFQRKKVLKNCLENLCTKKLSCSEETLLKTLQGDWSPLGGPLQGLPSSFYSTWPRCGFSARLPRFLLDIGPSLGLCPLKIWGPGQAKGIKASSVLIWRTMA